LPEGSTGTMRRSEQFLDKAFDIIEYDDIADGAAEAEDKRNDRTDKPAQMRGSKEQSYQ